MNRRQKKKIKNKSNNRISTIKTKRKSAYVKVKSRKYKTKPWRPPAPNPDDFGDIDFHTNNKPVINRKDGKIY